MPPKKQFQDAGKMPTKARLAMQKTGYEKGYEEDLRKALAHAIQASREEGARQAECAMLIFQLEERFGEVPPRARRRVEKMTGEDRRWLCRRILWAASLRELGL
jgi:hypothetical protein